jgi:hypothetical protein
MIRCVSEPVRPELGDFSLDVVDAKQMWLVELVRVAMCGSVWRPMAIAQELDFGSREAFSSTSVTCSASMPGTPM